MKGLGVSAVLTLGSIVLSSETYGEISAYIEDLPLYLLDYPFSGTEKPSPENIHRIGIERVAAYRDAFSKLFEMGHRKFLIDDNKAKMIAFREVAVRYSEPFDSRCVLSFQEGDFETGFASGVALSEEVLKKIELTGATVVSLHDDELAAGVVTGLLAAGVSIPESVSVLGFDNIDAAAHFRVPLSSIEIPTRRMVDVAVSAVCGETPLRGDVVMPGRLIMRDSISVLGQPRS
jgi:LacI family transcriptional regulator